MIRLVGVILEHLLLVLRTHSHKIHSVTFQSPPTGVSCWVKSEGDLNVLGATILGPEESPYAEGSFSLDIRIPQRYPFEPPEGMCNMFGMMRK